MDIVRLIFYGTDIGPYDQMNLWGKKINSPDLLLELSWLSVEFWESLVRKICMLVFDIQHKYRVIIQFYNEN